MGGLVTSRLSILRAVQKYGVASGSKSECVRKKRLPTEKPHLDRQSWTGVRGGALWGGLTGEIHEFHEDRDGGRPARRRDASCSSCRHFRCRRDVPLSDLRQMGGCL